MSDMTALDIANYLRSLTPRQRAELKHTAILTEAAASAAMATRPTPEKNP